jgi:hypothetical protein
LKNDERRVCRVEGCQRAVPYALKGEMICATHYVDEAMQKLENAAALCRRGHAVESGELERLHAQADFAVRRLAGEGGQDTNHDKDRLLQFLLGLANLHQFLSHNVSLVARTH